METNPIQITDLFSSDFSTSLESIIKNLESGATRLESAINGVKAKAKELDDALKTSAGSGAGKGNDAPKQVEALNAEYKKLLQTYGIYKEQIKEVTVVQRDQNQIQKLQAQFAASSQGSFNKLSAEYRLLKIASNEVSQEWLEQNDSGKALVARMKELYDAMNKYQMSTGKYQMNVGNYAKATNGLGLAMSQVVREVPTLQNSLNQFAVAISNNIPILVDQIQIYSQQHREAIRVQKEFVAQGLTTEQAMKAMGAQAEFLGSTVKAVGKSFFSFNLVIVALITAFEFATKAIQKHKKEQKELNDAVKEGVTYQKLYSDSLKAIDKATIESTAKLRTLYEITQDSTRSLEERTRAAKALRAEQEETFQGFSNEAIVAGKAKTAYDQLTESLDKQARVRATFNKIVELYQKQIDLQFLKDEAIAMENVAKQTQEQANQYTLLDWALTGIVPSLETVREMFRKISTAKDVKDAAKNVQELDIQLQDVDNTIFQLKKQLDTEGILPDNILGDGPELTKEIADYYNQSLNAIINLQESSLEKELNMLDLQNKERLEKRKKNEEELLEVIRTANGERLREAQQQLSNLRLIETAELLMYERARREIIQKAIDSYKEVVEEEDVDNVLRNNLKTRLKLEQEYAKSSAYARYEASVEAGENEVRAKEELNQTLIGLERKYWQDYLTELRAQGLLTVEAYNEIMENLTKNIGKQAKTGRGKRARDFANIFEAVFGISGDTGFLAKDIFGNLLLDESGRNYLSDEARNYARALNEALKSSVDSMQEWMDARIEMAKIAVEAAEREVDATKSALDYEREARANGYANSVDMAKREYEARLAIQEQALQEQRRLENIQNQIDSATQVSSLVTATANIIKGYSSIPILGQALGLAAIATMWGTFTAAKVKAAQIAKTKTYGEGMGEYLNYGGSHASGNDIDFGTTRNGTRRRVERGEIVGVINKKNVKKYGVDEVLGIIKSLNSGTFEEKYGGAFGGLTMLQEGSSSDLSKLEKGLDTLVAQGAVKEYYEGGKRIQIYKNVRRVITNA